MFCNIAHPYVEVIIIINSTINLYYLASATSRVNIQNQVGYRSLQYARGVAQTIKCISQSVSIFQLLFLNPDFLCPRLRSSARVRCGLSWAVDKSPLMPFLFYFSFVLVAFSYTKIQFNDNLN